MKPKDYECDGWQLSDCCGANIILGDICSDCKEHCSTQCYYCECNSDCDNSSEKENNNN